MNKKYIIIAFLAGLLIVSGIGVSAFILINHGSQNEIPEERQMITPDTKSQILTDVSIGDTVTFGNYEQDNDISNGKENIEWIVLEKSDDKLFLISKQELDCKRFNETCTSVTWEGCSLRAWLNDIFIKEAFSAEEEEMLIETAVPADRNPSYGADPGNDTIDKVFLLSIKEAEKYFSNDEERKCAPTEYAIANGGRPSEDKTIDGKGSCEWWLRTVGFNDLGVSMVIHTGGILDSGKYVNVNDCCVRPALWISLAS